MKAHSTLPLTDLSFHFAGCIRDFFFPCIVFLAIIMQQFKPAPQVIHLKNSPDFLCREISHSYNTVFEACKEEHYNRQISLLYILQTWQEHWGLFSAAMRAHLQLQAPQTVLQLIMSTNWIKALWSLQMSDSNMCLFTVSIHASRLHIFSIIIITPAHTFSHMHWPVYFRFSHLVLPMRFISSHIYPSLQRFILAIKRTVKSEFMFIVQGNMCKFMYSAHSLVIISHIHKPLLFFLSTWTI